MLRSSDHAAYVKDSLIRYAVSTIDQLKQIDSCSNIKRILLELSNTLRITIITRTSPSRAILMSTHIRHYNNSLIYQFKTKKEIIYYKLHDFG